MRLSWLCLNVRPETLAVGLETLTVRVEVIALIGGVYCVHHPRLGAKVDPLRKAGSRIRTRLATSTTALI